MPKMIVTTREMRYAGKTYLRDAEFEASDKDAKILTAVRKAAPAPERKPVRQVATTKPPEPKLETASKAEVSALTTDDAPTTGGRFYATRRLKAED